MEHAESWTANSDNIREENSKNEPKNWEPPFHDVFISYFNIRSVTLVNINIQTRIQTHVFENQIYALSIVKTRTFTGYWATSIRYIRRISRELCLRLSCALSSLQNIAV